MHQANRQYTLTKFYMILHTTARLGNSVECKYEVLKYQKQIKKKHNILCITSL